MSIETIANIQLAPVTIGRTTFSARREIVSYTDGRNVTSTYLTGPRGAEYVLVPMLSRTRGDIGVRRIVSMASGAPYRPNGNEAFVLESGDTITAFKR